MKRGVAMYTVHNNARKDLYKTMQMVREEGYEEIEFFGPMTTWTPAEIRHALEDSGLTFTGWHTEWADLQEKHFDETVEYLKKAGCPIAVIPCLGGQWNIGHTAEEECRETWLRHFETFETIHAKLKADGLETGYHNHSHEFELSYEGKSLFEFIFDTLPRDVIIEFDSGNCIEGGGDPMCVLEKYRDRDMILHLKPWSRTNGFDTWIGAPDDANDWARILDPRVKTYRHLLVESENAVLDEMVNLKRCMEGINRFIQ